MTRAWPLALLLACRPPAPATVDAGAPDGGVASSCATWGEPRTLATIGVPGLVEASGLVAATRTPDLLFALNDSGNPPELFAFSALDGAAAGRWTVAGATNRDWEELARGPCPDAPAESCLYVADVGDNAAARETVTVYVIAEPVPGTPEPLPVRSEFSFAWEGGPLDVEALVVHPQDGSVWAIGKARRADGHPVFRWRPGETTAARIGTLTSEAEGDGLVTGAALDATGTRLAVRTYTTLQERRLPAGRPFEEMFVAPAVTLPGFGPGTAALEQQGEAVAYAADGRTLLTTSEGAGPPLNGRPCEP